MNDTGVQSLAQVKTLTEPFRFRKARDHQHKAREARQLYTRAVEAWTESGAVDDPEAAAAAEHFVSRDGEVTLVRDVQLDAMRSAVTTQKWHEGRARGQEARFERLALCGTRVVIARCNTCGGDGKPMPEACGVARLCARCSLQHARRRLARFARARARAYLEAERHGLLLRNRRDGYGRVGRGQYRDRMLTLTVPHYTCDQIAAEAARLDHEARTGKLRTGEVVGEKECRTLRARASAARDLLRAARGSDVRLRVAVLWAAWPYFRRELSEHFFIEGEDHVKVHRAFEWTPGNDGFGHPHFHCWMLSPFLAGDVVARLWTEAVRRVGGAAPRGGDGTCRVTIQEFKAWNAQAATELLKGSTKRQAITLSRLAKRKVVGDAARATSKRGPDSAFEYADGWTIAEVLDFSSPDVLADLYESLEGKRLSQATRGFFRETYVSSCPCCFAEGTREVRFEPRPPDVEDVPPATGPPI